MKPMTLSLLDYALVLGYLVLVLAVAVAPNLLIW